MIKGGGMGMENNRIKIVASGDGNNNNHEEIFLNGKAIEFVKSYSASKCSNETGEITITLEYHELELVDEQKG